MSKVIDVKFFDIGNIEDSSLVVAVIASRYKGKWVFCKHRERNTWELPGGHRENNENIINTARRELFEETGAVEFDLTPVCVYTVLRDTPGNKYGLLCYADVKKFEELPLSEMERVEFFEDMPENLTYPAIQPRLLEKVKEFILL